MTQEDFFEKNIRYLKGVGAHYETILARKGVKTLYDLVTFFPRDYEDRSIIRSIEEALQHPDENSVVKAEIVIIDMLQVNFRNIPKLVITDGESACEVPVFSGRLPKNLKAGDKIRVVGKFRLRRYGLQCSATEIESDSEESLSSGRIVPIYPLTEGLTHRKLRALIHSLIDTISDEKPYEIPSVYRSKYRLLRFIEAITQMHFPTSFDAINEARRTLIFEEFLAFQYLSQSANRPKSLSKNPRYFKREVCDIVKNSLPYKLTAAQEKVLEEIIADLKGNSVMLRMLQGDVGSGKTICALLSAIFASENGFQTAVLVPTEILARQHLRLFKSVLKESEIEVDLLTGSLNAAEKGYAIKRLREGTTDIVVGTHALLSPEVIFKRLSYVIVDEQQRFGVNQRNTLLSKGDNPDYLLMTATPIPQSLAMTLFGELNLSVIDEMPLGRSETKTKHLSKEDALHCYRFMRSRVKKGEQGYVVYPAIDSSEDDANKSLLAEFEYAKKAYFPDMNINLVHGRMKDEERDEIMRAFFEGEISVLFATSVIEVGIDNPNATTIVIEGAEYFGLSQLHQMRGRVGRGNKEGYCYLVSHSNLNEEAGKRMSIMCESTDGFKISETDLQIRGAGELLGSRQSGMPEFKLGNIIKDIKIMKVARDEARELTTRNLDEAKPEIRQFLKRCSYLKIAVCENE